MPLPEKKSLPTKISPKIPLKKLDPLIAPPPLKWPPKNLQVHILTDTEYNNIAEEHGLALTQGGKWTYGFPPVQGFHRFMGGVILKNAWLPERLQKVAQE